MTTSHMAGGRPPPSHRNATVRYVCGEDPAGQIAIAEWPENMVKMVVHQALGQQAHGFPLAGQRKDPVKCLKVPFPAKDICAAIAPIDNVPAIVTGKGQKRARHGAPFTTGRRVSKKE